MYKSKDKQSKLINKTKQSMSRKIKIKLEKTPTEYLNKVHKHSIKNYFKMILFIGNVFDYSKKNNYFLTSVL